MPADMYPDGTDFTVTHPDTGVLFNTGTPDTDGKKQIQNYFFQFPYVLPHAEVIFFEIHNRITHELSRTMVGGATSPIGVEDGDITFSQCLWRHHDVFFTPEAPDGKNRRVLQKQQPVRDNALGARLHQCFL